MPEYPSALVLLAAGSSSRMGSPKQLLTFRGKPLLRHAVETAVEAGCSPIVVVLGCRENDMWQALDGLPVEVVVNQRWTEGMGTSIQAGLDVVKGRGIVGAILALADQPFITAEYLRNLVATHRSTNMPIVASEYSGTVGVPVFFAKEAFPHLLALKPDQGCKGVILSHSSEAILQPCPEAAIDLDTPDDYARALRLPG